MAAVNPMVPATMDPNTLHHDELLYELQIRGVGVTNFDSVEDLAEKCVRNGDSPVEEDAVSTLDCAREYECLRPKAAELEALLAEMQTLGVIVDRPYRLVSLFVHCVFRLRRVIFRARGATYEQMLNLGHRLNNFQQVISAVGPTMIFPALHLPKEDDLGRLLEQNLRSPDSRSARNSRNLRDEDQEEHHSGGSNLESRRPKYNPVTKWTVRFTRGEDLPKFLEDVEELANMHAVKDEELLRGISGLLTGDAKVWYRAASPAIHTWEDCKQKMYEAFAPADNDEAVLEKINGLKQRGDETYVVFEAKMKQLFQRLVEPLSETQKVKKILNCLHHYYRSRVRSSEIRSLRDLSISCASLEQDKPQIFKLEKEDARRKEDKKKDDRRPHVAELVQFEAQVAPAAPAPAAPAVEALAGPSSGARPPTNARPSTALQCWRCLKGGHFSKDCTEKLFCTVCGAADTLAERCARCKEANVRRLWSNPSQMENSMGGWAQGGPSSSMQAPLMYDNPVMHPMFNFMAAAHPPYPMQMQQFSYPPPPLPMAHSTPVRPTLLSRTQAQGGHQQGGATEQPRPPRV